MDAFLEFGLESPSWGEVMKTPIRRELADRGFRLFHRERSCASCHGTYSREGMLERFKPAIIPLDEIRTDPERAVAASDELLSRFQQYGWAFVPRLSGLGKDYPLGYQATPLCSPFLNFPYLHTAGVASLDELLLSEERRSRVFRVSEQVDEEHVGYFVHGSGRARHVSERALRGHSGERYGSDLGAGERAELVEYLKTLRCPM
jgi:hypothetical protein